MRLFWLLIGGISVALGVLGMFLPLLPTVVFFLIAAYSFSKSSPRLHQWLITHEQFGPPVVAWYEKGAISRSAKSWATVSIIASFAISVWAGAPNWVLVMLAAILTCVLIFIWTRPDD